MTVSLCLTEVSLRVTLGEGSKVMKKLLFDYECLISDYWLGVCLLNPYDEGFYQNNMKAYVKVNVPFCIVFLHVHHT